MLREQAALGRAAAASGAHDVAPCRQMPIHTTCAACHSPCVPQGENPQWCSSCDGNNPTKCIKVGRARISRGCAVLAFEWCLRNGRSLQMASPSGCPPLTACRAEQPRPPTAALQCNDWEFSDPVYVTKQGTCARCPEGCSACDDYSARCTACNEGERVVYARHRRSSVTATSGHAHHIQIPQLAPLGGPSRPAPTANR